MDQFLSELYGTTKTASAEAPAATEDELEKMAQVYLLAEDAAAKGVDLSQYSDEEILKTASELYSGEAAPEGEADPEAIEKFAEFDFGGRVMAHAFTQELGNIEKEAGRAGDAYQAVKGGLGRALSAVKKAPGQAYESTLGRVGSAAEKAVTERGRKGGLSDIEKAIIHRLGGAKGDVAKGGNTYRKGLERLSRAAGIGSQVATGVGAAGAVGGAGYGGYRGVQALREKKSSAIEEAVTRKAVEKLAEAGWVDVNGNITPPPAQEQEKVAGDFESRIEGAALEYLASLGYPVAD